VLCEIQYHSRSRRLTGWDYASPGVYFVTICTQGHRCWFGEVKDGRMVLNKLGQIAEMYWREIPIHHDNVLIDAFVIMPNHVHGIILIPDSENTPDLYVATSLRGVQQSDTEYFSAISPKQGSLSTIICGDKSTVTKKIHADLNPMFAWQARFYDHIIRTEPDHENLRWYISRNPANWHNDEQHDAGVFIIDG
jgi:putative transposase